MPVVPTPPEMVVIIASELHPPTIDHNLLQISKEQVIQHRGLSGTKNYVPQHNPPDVWITPKTLPPSPPVDLTMAQRQP